MFLGIILSVALLAALAMMPFRGSTYYRSEVMEDAVGRRLRDEQR